MTTVIETPLALQALTKTWNGRRVGFVPTMGALHAGHVSLLRRSRSENDVSVLSIFVNPTQFNDPKDLERYPRTWEADLQIAREAGVDYVFAPRSADMYPDGLHHFFLDENDLSQRFCGKSRSGHFRGVLTVVMKLLQIVQPTRAYFGEKDYQQYLLIKGMAEAFFMPIEIVSCPTLRDEKGLALSSRNTLLSPPDLEDARRLNRILRDSASSAGAAEALQKSGFRVDYVEDYGPRRLAAVFCGPVRLIDNIELPS